MFAHCSLRAVAARLAIAAPLALAAGGALAQSYSDVGGTKAPASVLLGGCIANGACAGPNSAISPLYAAPSTGVTFPISGSVGITGPLPDTSGGALAAAATDLGAPGTTACVSDTASCSLNALAQRVAQRLTTLIGSTLSFKQAGSTGSNSSANAPTLPNVGAAFGSSGPYANYLLVATLAASTSRASVDVENTSGAQIAVVLDDGTAAAGAAPANASVFALASGSAVGAQGGSWVSQSEKGRVQIYAPASTAQVMVRQN